MSKISFLASEVKGPAPKVPFLLIALLFVVSSRISFRKNLKSYKGFNQSSPVSIKPFIDLSSVTTVQTQQPNLLEPQEGCSVFVINSHSPPCAFVYKFNNSS